MAEFSIAGMPEFLNALQKLDYTKQKKVLMKAVKEGAEPIRIRAGELAPRGDTGNLAESQMITAAGSGSDINEVSVKIGPALDAFYGLFQEKGTQFAPAQSFLGPAFEEKLGEAQQTIGEVLWNEIMKAAR